MKKRVTGVRLNQGEREALLKIGAGSLSDAIRKALALLFEQHKVKPTT